MKTIILATTHKRHDALELITRETLNDFRVIRISDSEELKKDYLEQLNPAWIFFPHWSWFIPAEIFENFQCVVFHMTDLPYGRGGSPLQNLILRGHTHTRLSAIKCVKSLDAGPIYTKRDLSLEGTAEEILVRASRLISEIIIWIVRNNPAPTKQKGEAVFFHRRNRADGNLGELKNLDDVYDYIRMLDGDGYPPAYISTQYLDFEFVDAKLNNDFVEARVFIRKRHNE